MALERPQRLPGASEVWTDRQLSGPLRGQGIADCRLRNPRDFHRFARRGVDPRHVAGAIDQASDKIHGLSRRIIVQFITALIEPPASPNTVKGCSEILV